MVSCIFFYAIISTCLKITILCYALELNHDKNISAANLNKNYTKLTVDSEGGSIPVVDSFPSLLKDNDTAFINKSKEFGKSKVVARKGVDNETSSFKIIQNSLENEVVQQVNNSLIQHNNTGTELSPKPLTILTINHNTNETIILNETVIHKKPLLLDYDALENFSDGSGSDKMSHGIPSKILSDSNNLNSNRENEAPIKTLKNRHPEIIVPVVITMLIVPVFAVLGYIALKRGQEAWRNRHYKRMDFLLDGMYND